MRKLIMAATVAAVMVGAAAPAWAGHTHARMTGNGECVILAANGGEKEVQLPFADGIADPTRRHPLHVNVHLGEPGTVQGETVIWVFGPASDANCTGYVND